MSMSKSSIVYIFLAFFVPFQSAFAYIVDIRVYHHPASNKTVMLLGDMHNLGSVAENDHQFEVFSELLTELGRDLSPVSILLEDFRRFNYRGCPVPDSLTLLSEMSVEHDATPEQSSWLAHAWRDLTNTRSPFFPRAIQLKLRSIDPRFPSQCLAESMYEVLIDNDSDAIAAVEKTLNGKISRRNMAPVLDLNTFKIPKSAKHFDYRKILRSIVKGMNERMHASGIVSREVIMNPIAREELFMESVEANGLREIANAPDGGVTISLVGLRHSRSMARALEIAGFVPTYTRVLTPLDLRPSVCDSYMYTLLEQHIGNSERLEMNIAMRALAGEFQRIRDFSGRASEGVAEAPTDAVDAYAGAGSDLPPSATAADIELDSAIVGFPSNDLEGLGEFGPAELVPINRDWLSLVLMYCLTLSAVLNIV